MRLLVTRPQPDAERTAAGLRERGHAVIVAPLLRIEAVTDAEIAGGPFAAILVTSANAAPAIARHQRVAGLWTLPVFAVGERTAQAMREIGFTDISCAGGAAGELAALVTKRLQPGQPLLYLAGADRSGDLAGVLAARHFDVRTVVVYRAVAADRLPAEAVEALVARIDGVLHFSRRTAEVYLRAARIADLLPEALKPIHFCLSAQVAEPLQQAGAPDVRIAAEPTEAALLSLVPAA